MRLAIISDIHEDFPSLWKVILKAERKGYDTLICLGDISGFSKEHYRYRKDRDAHACLSLIREKCDIVVPGNHDFHAARRIPIHSKTFDFPENWYELTLDEKRMLTDDKVWLHDMDDLPHNYNNEDLNFIGELPEYHVFPSETGNILLSHYAFPNLSGSKKGFYTWEKEFLPHFEFMKSLHCKIAITGHGHVRGFYLVNEQRFRHYSYRKVKVRPELFCIGIPPVTRQKSRRGFCIFDSDSLEITCFRV